MWREGDPEAPASSYEPFLSLGALSLSSAEEPRRIFFTEGSSARSLDSDRDAERPFTGDLERLLAFAAVRCRRGDFEPDRDWLLAERLEEDLDLDLRRPEERRGLDEDRDL